jgi:2-polyprenyl-3-methyl-5-hydroxy-6-metoxy-1,4-benzoquinol methylase
MSSERQLDDTNNPWWGEHLHRYQEAAMLLPKGNLKILDIASGSGFGSNFLAQLGYTVIGGDISSDAIQDCQRKFHGQQNLSFEIVDGTNLSYPNETFDAIISFETIEHTAAYQKMLNEFKRVLKKDALLILSTPNFLINSPKGIVTNPYHTQEWVYEDLLKLLSNTFSSVKLSGQKYIRYQNKNSLKYKIGFLAENLLYCRGLRKTPIYIQDKIMQSIIGEPMYPSAKNYLLVNDTNQAKQCKTFFAVCQS